MHSDIGQTMYSTTLFIRAEICLSILLREMIRSQTREVGLFNLFCFRALRQLYSEAVGILGDCALCHMQLTQDVLFAVEQSLLTLLSNLAHGQHHLTLTNRKC